MACVWACKRSPGPMRRLSSSGSMKSLVIWPQAGPRRSISSGPLQRMKQAAERLRGRPTPEIAAGLLDEARAIHEEDRKMCRAIGRHGAALLRDGQGVLTHCNAGGLATSDYGTALAVFYAAAEAGKTLHVFADETRPLLQGARLTAWELQQRGIDVTVICDSMGCPGDARGQGAGGGYGRGSNRRQWRFGEQDRAPTAWRFWRRPTNIPFYIAAPSSTFDLSIQSGDEIPIEQRDRAK